MRARLAGLERRVNDPTADKARLVADCLRELASAVGQLEAARDQLRDREGEVMDMRGRLADWQQRLVTLLDTLDDAYLLTALDGVILESNQAAARLLNLSSRFLARRPLHLFLAGGRVEFLRFLQGLPATPQPEPLILRIRPRERHSRLVGARARVVHDSGGQPRNVQWLLAREPEPPPDLTAAVAPTLD